MRNKRIEIAVSLVNQEINEILRFCGNNPESSSIYAIRYGRCDDDGFSLQATHAPVFHGINKFINIADVCGLSTYVDIQPNADGINTPTLHVF